ncbi:hypothetical protein V8G54_021146 [Vigna mungo]|uniref:Methyltransferase n=1 Tax=Vigna mungo TaxID=3915 RepID=A0AAQ3NCV4_VIGMU
MVTVTKAMCWSVVAKTLDSSGIGLVIYQKPTSSSCYQERKENTPPLSHVVQTETIEENVHEPTIASNAKHITVTVSLTSIPSDFVFMIRYAKLSGCLIPLPVDGEGNIQSWPMSWPQRLTGIPPSLSSESDVTEKFLNDTKHWSELVSDVYIDGLSINWSSVRNVMDMNAGYAGFAASLIDLPVWVMNVVPIDMPDTLTTIFDRGLIGLYHDWCESLSTYPRTYDLVHASFLFKHLEQRCEIVDVVVEIDRILRPDGYVLVQDTVEMMNKLGPVLHSLHWSVTLYQNRFLVGKKSFWRPRP